MQGKCAANILFATTIESGFICDWRIIFQVALMNNKTDHGKIKIWRDYGQAWGSPIYDVLTYCTGTFADATALAHTYRGDDA